MLSSFRGRRYVLVGGLAAFIFFTLCWQSRRNIFFEDPWSAPQNDAPSDEHPAQKQDYSPKHTDSPPLALSPPGDYHLTPAAPPQSPFCAERFDLQYLRNLAKTQTSYCDADSKSSMTCFHSHIDPGGRTDSFCISGPATFDYKQKKFILDCSLRPLSAEESSRVPKFEEFPTYWYGTGPRQIFNDFISLDQREEPSHNLPHGRRNFSILIKREDSHYNIFHSLMEIIGLSLTLDTMRMSQNRDTNFPFFMSEDFDNAQVIILDDLLDGPYFDLWKLFANQPAIRLKDISASAQINLDNIIVPLPGGGSPFWQNHWEPLPCEQSELLRTFAKRVLKFYNIRDEARPQDSPLVLTFIDRKEKRRLINQERYIERLKAKFPEVEVNVIDLAALPFSEQIKLVRHTDILAGVHGAGLTHGIFLPSHSTIAEILPPKLEHKGFRNLAKKLGHRYFSSHGVEHQTNDTKNDWQFDDVFIEEDRFMNLLEIAVKSMYNRGLYNKDIN
ncbi:hypothetical protein EMCG_06523 [[Emmonsia] crescens]|uniref:EGF domain-specific O-linked N-acetylglucosamine transferase n=1 Tax=[Emmonsia] crescens TaxID=73230 RepID=A0A0G2IBA9_9EURO|nr:hypothetical protein EMCG_06523 [Emmonsia crescens UAMH 3008]